jgi:hypothetical protein
MMTSGNFQANEEVPRSPDWAATWHHITSLNGKIVLEIMGFDPMTYWQGKRFGKGLGANMPQVVLVN